MHTTSRSRPLSAAGQHWGVAECRSACSIFSSRERTELFLRGPSRIYALRSQVRKLTQPRHKYQTQKADKILAFSQEHTFALYAQSVCIRCACTAVMRRQTSRSLHTRPSSYQISTEYDSTMWTSRSLLPNFIRHKHDVNAHKTHTLTCTHTHTHTHTHAHTHTHTTHSHRNYKHTHTHTEREREHELEIKAKSAHKRNN